MILIFLCPFLNPSLGIGSRRESMQSKESQITLHGHANKESKGAFNLKEENERKD